MYQTCNRNDKEYAYRESTGAGMDTAGHGSTALGEVQSAAKGQTGKLWGTQEIGREIWCLLTLIDETEAWKAQAVFLAIILHCI